MSTVRACIGLGSNLDEPRRHVQVAVRELARLPHSRLVAVSRLYRSAPVDAAGPDYVNAVAAVDTMLEPLALLQRLQAIEGVHGLANGRGLLVQGMPAPMHQQ